MLKLLTTILLFITLSSVSLSQEVFKGGGQNSAGEYCCGIADCGFVDPKGVKATRFGYAIDGYVWYGETINNSTGDKSARHAEYYRETIPYSEVKPSPDGSYWRCKRPDRSMRCFFAPPPGS